jgi:precorrin-2 methylase
MMPSDKPALGSIALIGGGPGDVDLLTLRAVERLRAADVILMTTSPAMRSCRSPRRTPN